jgi:2-C-methyl-D-erythritol 2,4-cyclodiphosphate synthase
MITDKGFTIQNIDCTVVCQRPKLAPHIPLMVEKIASALNAAATQINVKATTEEGLGFTGAGEGIAAHAVCLLRGAHHG